MHLNGREMSISLSDLIMSLKTNWGDILSSDDILSCVKHADKQLLEDSDKTIYPDRSLIFNAFSFFNIEDTRVVIIGLDPYINDNQAMGLSFSVPACAKIPPSLKNIFKEIRNNYEGLCVQDINGDLTRWAMQGVLLLNCYLTVEAGKTGSHKQLWNDFSNYLIRDISTYTTNVVFMLWGNDAKKRTDLIDSEKHLVLSAAHPSPLSASRGFLGCKHFIRCNEYLREKDKQEIIW